MNRHKRAEQVNEAIKIIGSHGRRFFYNKEHDRFARMEVDERGKVWFVDDYSGKRIYTHPTGFSSRWRGFTHGGTLHNLVEEFREYIAHGLQVWPGFLGPERGFDESNIWGYPEEDMKKVRETAGALPVFRQQ
ncbi:hypothetical protein ACS8E9_09585 [Pseudomonas neustonica]|uniref:hypothetical protein n=1 Tax=Pseudomonas neustonica TaxID=2487346 RepID=UPI003F488060